MKICSLYPKQKPTISFEVFPPKPENFDQVALDKTLAELSALKPDFISVTCGAGGQGVTNRTAEIARTLKQQYQIEPLPHLTCINSSPTQIDATLQQLAEYGMENVLALRGDLPKGGCKEPPHFHYAKDLIQHIDANQFCIGGAAYPEGHIDCGDSNLNMAHLKEKVAAGAQFLITQLFFDNHVFYRFQEQLAQAGIDTPIIPGVMPLLSQSQVERMIFMCAASLPVRIIKILNKYRHNPADLKQAGIEYAAGQASELVQNGVDGVHIYTMNQPIIAKTCLEAIDAHR